MNNVPIFSLKIAKDMLNEGFKIVDIAHNTKASDKLVFYFSRTDEFVQLLKDKYNLEV